jgi:hypothetical protein
MSPADFIKEHKRLIKILTSGSPTKRKEEAKAQAAELRRFLKGKK